MRVPLVGPCWGLWPREQEAEAPELGSVVMLGRDMPVCPGPVGSPTEPQDGTCSGLQEDQRSCPDHVHTWPWPSLARGPASADQTGWRGPRWAGALPSSLTQPLGCSGDPRPQPPVPPEAWPEALIPGTCGSHLHTPGGSVRAGVISLPDSIDTGPRGLGSSAPPPSVPASVWLEVSRSRLPAAHPLATRWRCWPHGSCRSSWKLWAGLWADLSLLTWAGALP